jgi:hypothetical protein
MARPKKNLESLLTEDKSSGKKDLRDIKTDPLKKAEAGVKRKTPSTKRLKPFQIRRDVYDIYDKEARRKDIPFPGRLIHIALEKYAIDNGFMKAKDSEHFSQP